MAWWASFRGQAVLVTGASSGIGRAVAVAFAKAEARVALVARRRAALVAVAAEADGETLVVPADVTDPAQVAAAVATAVDAFGHLDVVVNNAGILIPARVETMAPADLDAMLRVNVFGALHVLQAALPHLRARGAGRVVNVA